MIPTRVVALLLVVLASGSIGCLGIGESSPPIRYWVLDGLSRRPELSESDRVIAVGPVELPSHLDRPNIVMREGDNRLAVSSLDHWGEPLLRGIERVLTENLTILVPGLKAVRFPWKGPIRPEQQIAVGITRLDARPSGEVVLIATWVLTRTSDASVVAVRTSWIEEPPSAAGVGGVVAGISRAIERLSRELADALIAEGGVGRVDDASP